MTTLDEDDNRWSLQEEISKVFKASLLRYVPDLPDEEPYIVPLYKKEIGDYECNNVVRIRYEKTHECMGIKHIAEAIKNNLPASASDMMEECRIQSIGFLTFKLSRIWIAKKIHKMLTDGIDTWAPKLPMKKALVYFSSRKIAEELDVGHLRSTIIGDTLVRMLEFSKVDVILINHFGDHYDTQGGHKKYLEAWVQFVVKDLQGYIKVYQRLGVHVEQRAKHFYYPYIQQTLDLLRQEGLTEKSEGDEVIFVEEKKKVHHELIERKKKPLTVVNKNEGYGNALTDLAALWYELKEKKAEWIVYVADVEKEEYTEMCIEAARRAGWLPTDEDEYPRAKFVGYGLVQGDDLNRAVKLVDLLDGAKACCKATLVEQGKADEWTAEELDNTAEALGYGAVKYAHLKKFRVFNYTFNIDEILNDKGNTVVYLLCTHAQICSVINKSGKNIEKLKKTRELILEKDEERKLGLHLLQFTEVLELTCTTVLPNILCKYLYELSEKFTSFYSVVCQAVGGADEEANRVLVCEATRVVMRKCFHLLGITPIDKISISKKMSPTPPVERGDDDVMESFSSDEDKEETVSSSSEENRTPAKRFKSSDLTVEEEEKKMTTPPSVESDDDDVMESFSIDENKEEMVSSSSGEKNPTPRFQLFSARVHVDKYKSNHKQCLLFGSISVSDLSVSSEEDGWVPTDDPDYGYVDLFYCDCHKPLPITNNGYIYTLTHPTTHRSIPFYTFLDILVYLYMFNSDDNGFFQVSEEYTHFRLSDIIYDNFFTQISRGPDGHVELVFIVLSDPVDAALEMPFIINPGDDVFKQPISVKIFAYYGLDYDYGRCSLKKSSYNVTLLEDDSVTMFDKSKIPLNTSVLAVPAKGSLIIDVLIKDFNGDVIVKDIFDFPAKRKGSSSSITGHLKEAGISYELKVNWKYEAAT